MFHRYIVKGFERKSTLPGNIREKPSPAESGFCESVKEVHPGADLVKRRCLAGYVWHTLRVFKWRRKPLLEWNRG